MKKPDLEKLVKEFENLQVFKGKSYNEALKIIVEKYEYEDIDQLKKELSYYQLYILKFDLSIIIDKNIINNESVLIEGSNIIIKSNEMISNLSDDDEERGILVIEHQCMLMRITTIMLGDYTSFYKFSFTETGYTLYLYDDPSNKNDYTCSVEYVKETSQFLIAQRKETELLSRD